MIRLVLSIIILSLLSSTASAGPLKEILDSGELGHQSDLQQQKNLSNPKWFTPGTNYANLFLKHKGHDLLFGWMGKLGVSYDLKKKKAGKEKEYVFANQEFRSFDRELITISTIVPHPKFLELIELKLIPFFSKLEPKADQYQSKKNFEAAGVSWNAYQVNKHYCKAVASISKKSKIVVEVRPCKNIDRLITPAQKIDVPTIIHKLES